MITIFVLNIVAFIFILGVNFSSGIFSAYLKAFGATELIISLGAAALYLTRGTSSILIDKLSHKVSFKNLFIIAFLGSAISTYLFMLSHDPAINALLRTVQGIFSGLYWVLINIYAISLGSNSFEKFKNLSSVTIFLNIGGFIGCIVSGMIASKYSVYTSFYIGIVILLAGAFVCLFLDNIKSGNETKSHSGHNPIYGRERLILIVAVLTSSINAYVNIGIPLFILQLGGSYREIGITAGLGIVTSAIIIGFAPWLRKRFPYRTIIKVDYSLIILCLIAVFYFKKISLIYILQSILMGICALERNLWYAILHEYSKNYNKAIGILRGFIDYFGAILLLLYGYLIGTLGTIPVAVCIVFVAMMILTFVLNYKNLLFLKYKKSLIIKNPTQFYHALHRISE